MERDIEKAELFGAVYLIDDLLVMAYDVNSVMVIIVLGNTNVWHQRIHPHYKIKWMKFYPKRNVYFVYVTIP